MSDDNWKKGKEITNKDLTEAETATKSKMKNARLCDFIIDPHQKIYYVFDLGVWTFRIALPVPEDFDSLEDLDDAEDDEDDSDGDVLAIDTSELPEGEEKDDTFIAATGDVEESADDFGSDDENMLDDSISEDKDEF